eukprot:753480-Hanusia_phi.AAC.1
MSDPKVKKALKDLALPIKPAVTKTALLLADSMRKANNEAAKNDARKELSATYQEKDVVWEGGVMPLLAGVLGQAKDKLMLEALSLCFALALENCESNVKAVEKTEVAKSLVELSGNGSLIVQSFCSLAVSYMCKLGSSESRRKFIAAGAVRSLTTIISSTDSDELLSKQGVNKQIPYQSGQRQAAAIAALNAMLVEEEARELARSVGTIQHVVRLLQDSQNDVHKLEEGVGAALEIVKRPSNREEFCQAGGVEAVLTLVAHDSPLVRQRAAACLKEAARSQELRRVLFAANAVNGLVALCAGHDDDRTHVEVAGALLELSNESSGKVAMLHYQAAPVLTKLIKGDRLKDAEEHVIENVLAAIGFMCAYPEQNRKQEIIRLSSTGYVLLQDEVGKADVMDSIVALCEHKSFKVKNQAAAALAALCLLHSSNSRDAGRAGAAGTLLKLLLDFEEEVIQANVMKAMLSILVAFPPNATALKRIGAPAQLFRIRRESSSSLIRSLSELVAEQLGCCSAVDEEGNSQVMSYITLRSAYEEQVRPPPVVPADMIKAASPPDSLSRYIASLKACRTAIRDVIARDDNVMRWWMIAWHDLSSFRLANEGASGGARGSVRRRSDLAGHTFRIFCDVLYMAGASMLESLQQLSIGSFVGAGENGIDSACCRVRQARLYGGTKGRGCGEVVQSMAAACPDFEGPEFEEIGAVKHDVGADDGGEPNEGEEQGEAESAEEAMAKVRETLDVAGSHSGAEGGASNSQGSAGDSAGKDGIDAQGTGQADFRASPACLAFMSSLHLKDEIARLAYDNDLFLFVAKVPATWKDCSPHSLVQDLMAKLFALGATFHPREGIYV